MHAFWELSTERQFGHVIGPIPHSKIVAYGYRARLSEGMLRVFEHVIRELDEHWLMWQRDAQRKTEPTPGPRTRTR